jgi:phage terminase large subunit-like protein
MERAGKPLDPWQQDSLELMLSRGADGLYACFEYCELVARQNGKGAILEARALAGFLLLGEALIMWSAHEYKTAMESFRRMRSLLRRLGTPISDTLILLPADLLGHDVYVKVSNTNGDEGFERLDNEQRIKFVARSKGSGRGFTGDCVIIDEAFAYTQEQHEALAPTMSAMPNPQIIYTSSPPLSADTGDVLYSLKDRAEEALKTGVHDDLGYRDWGLAGDLDRLDEIDIDDPATIAAANPAMCTGRLTLRKIRKLGTMLGRRGFGRECLGLWPKRTEGAGVIDMKVWARLCDPESRRVGDVSIAFDIAPQRDYAAIAVFGLRDDELGHMQLVDYRPGTAWLVPRLVELAKVLNPSSFCCGRGTGASLATDLTEASITESIDPEHPVRGDLVITSVTDMAASTSQMIDALRDETVRHIGQEPLDTAASGVKIRRVGDSVAWARGAVGADTCPIVSVSLARWVHLARAHLVAETYDPLDNIW